MRKSTFCATLILGLCCLAASTSNAQQTYIYSQIAYNDSTNTVEGYSATEIDYSCSYDYHAYVDAFLYDQSNHLLDAGDDEEPQLAEVFTSASANAGTGYRVEGYHDVIALYYHQMIDKSPDGCWPCDGCYTDCYYFYDNWFWYDTFGFSSTSPGYYGPWWYPFGNGPPVEVENDEYIPLGSTSATVANAVTFKTARVSGTSTNFDNSLRRAVLNLPPGTLTDGICHDFANFTTVVSFNVPDSATALSDSRSSVRAINAPGDSDTHDWFINGGTFQNVNLQSTPKSGEMAISMHRRTSGASEAPSISITVAGDYGTGTFSGTAALTINCP